MSNFREGLNALREISDPEKAKLILERITGKKLADYEGIDALVGALMGYYNGELEKKANSNHTHDYAPNNHSHDDRYYTEGEIDEKLKNFCPFKVGEILLTTNPENPASKYLGTTWQKIEGKFLLGTNGSGASKATGGSSTKRLTIDEIPSHDHSATTANHTHSRGTMNITGDANLQGDIGLVNGASGAFTYGSWRPNNILGKNGGGTSDLRLDASRTWGGSTSNASPITSISKTGGGKAFDILPPYYTCHMWLRLT